MTTTNVIVIGCILAGAILAMIWIGDLWRERPHQIIRAWDFAGGWLVLTGLLSLCLAGVFAALIGWRRLDAWCSKQLND